MMMAVAFENMRMTRIRYTPCFQHGKQVLETKDYTATVIDPHWFAMPM
jgi:hypothetical protein